MTRLYRLESILGRPRPGDRSATVHHRNHSQSALAEMARILARHEGEQRLLDSLLAGMAEGVAIADGSATILRINPAYQRITGRSAAQTLGRSLADPAGPHPLPGAIVSQLERADNEHNTWEGKVRAVRANGAIYMQRLTLHVIHNGDGLLEHYLLILALDDEQPPGGILP